MFKQMAIPVLLTAATASAVSAADVWSSFQNGGAIAVPDERVVQLGEVNWEVDLTGYGQSSPVVHDSQVYVTTVAGDNRDEYHLTAYRLKDGSQAWQHTVANPSPRENTSYHSRAAPTPAVDEAGIICFYEGGLVVSLTHDGELRWERNLVDDYGVVEARHGLAASVEQNDDSVFVWVERSEQPYVVCFSKQNGETKWKADGLGAVSWSSPRLVPVTGGCHLVLSGVGQLAGLDPASGRRLWSLDEISGNSTPTPVPLGDGRFLIGATVGRGESGGGRAAESNGLVEIRQADDGAWSADYVWRAKRATSSFGSPVVHRGIACFVNRAGVVYCLDAATGEERFAKRLKGSTWATPIAVGPRIFFFDRDGGVAAMSETDSDGEITWWNLPVPTPKSDKARSAESESATSAGAVLYAAAWLSDTVLFRRGDRLFAVGVEEQN